MANKKISELVPLNATPDANDILPLNDTSQGTTFSVKVSELQAATQSLASNLTDISTIAQANGTMIASDGTNFVSLGAIDSTGLSAIRADLGLGTAATTASLDYATAAQGATADTATQPADLGTAALLNVGVSIGNVVQLSANNTLPILDGSNLTGVGGAVEGTAVLSTGEGGGTKFLREDGDDSCSWQPIVVGDAELRGTTNPHIGAFPNQSFLVVDNPSKSVMLASDADGTLNVINSLGKFAIPVGLSVSEDSTEPDIEITTTSGTYSLITGDSDALGANGLPIRQGFNVPDIGANQAPILISGGSIA